MRPLNAALEFPWSAVKNASPNASGHSRHLTAVVYAGPCASGPATAGPPAQTAGLFPGLCGQMCLAQLVYVIGKTYRAYSGPVAETYSDVRSSCCCAKSR